MTTNAFTSQIRNATLPMVESPTMVYQDRIPDIFADEGGTENANVAEEGNEGESEEESEDKDVFVVGHNTLKEIEEAFRNMDDNQKWRLSTGKVVEDTLFEYGRQCKSEHLSQSFIVDPEDTNYIANGVFTEEELAEIEETDTKPLPDIPIDLMKYMDNFRQFRQGTKKTAIRGSRLGRSKFQKVQEYEGDNLVAGRPELHYLTHYWHIIDRCFLNLQDLHCLRWTEKNRTRHVSGLIQVARKMMGRRGDLIFRKHHNEYGNGEAGKQWEGENGSKILEERGLKGPKMQKDMFINLSCGEVGHREGGEVAEFVEIGFAKGYMCRVVRSPTYTIPQTVALFGQVIPFLALVWKAKAIVKEVVDVIESTQNRGSEEDQLQELQSVGCFNIVHSSKGL
ncbi:hypothetical protein BC937DRAFT_95215 [Endogone sp. FLAS-F59071]|nr:hypothetical protein BC937DRAFT_95215 [Endogone sp. FLAS-F59071]|eukprot:RUS23352.1 hypothetical protein BC937DRAFT_95215 [Endogone sp. FLAS-F59071]